MFRNQCQVLDLYAIFLATDQNENAVLASYQCYLALEKFGSK